MTQPHPQHSDHTAGSDSTSTPEISSTPISTSINTTIVGPHPSSVSPVSLAPLTLTDKIKKFWNGGYPFSTVFIVSLILFVLKSALFATLEAYNLISPLWLLVVLIDASTSIFLVVALWRSSTPTPSQIAQAKWKQPVSIIYKVLLIAALGRGIVGWISFTLFMLGLI